MLYKCYTNVLCLLRMVLSVDGAKSILVHIVF